MLPKKTDDFPVKVVVESAKSNVFGWQSMLAHFERCMYVVQVEAALIHISVFRIDLLDIIYISVTVGEYEKNNEIKKNIFFYVLCTYTYIFFILFLPLIWLSV
jgi:hypothetical protein